MTTASPSGRRFDTDVAVIGSGFGGSVAALRLAEKGYRVTVLEEGKRWSPGTLPRTNWDVRRFLWAPRFGMRGFFRMTLLRHALVLSGTAVGGGSVVYANTLYEPLPTSFRDGTWPEPVDWKAELRPHYDQAKRMLGVTPYWGETPADRVLRRVGERMGVADTFHPTDIGVYRGEPGRRDPDPYFGGVGPDRVGCIECGGCMVGCRFEAKNTLDHNYLYLAERLGAEVRAEHRVVDLEPLPGGGYRVTTERPGAWLRRRRRTLTAEQVIVAAGSLGTQRLLHRLKDDGRLPHLSDRLGTLVRTNSEAIVGATAPPTDPTDYSQGPAITSSIHVDEHTHIEPVRYPKGSDAIGLISTILVDGGGRVPRALRFVATALRHPVRFVRSLKFWGWAQHTVILLVMQSRDNSIVTRLRRRPWGRRLVTRRGHGEPSPTWIPAANEAARIAADEMQGIPLGSIFEALFDIPTTAHLIGGVPLGRTPDEGVVDLYHRAFGHAGLHVMDGSTVTANLGSNPSLTITAMAERAMAMWPNHGEPDPRPPLVGDYVPVAPVPPRNPAVPADAPAALRWGRP